MFDTHCNTRMKNIIQNSKDLMQNDDILLILDIEPEEIRSIVTDLEETTIVTNTMEEMEGHNVVKIHVPEVFSDVEVRVQFAVATMLKNKSIELGDRALVVSDFPKLRETIITRVNVNEEYLQPEMIKFFLETSASTETIHETLSLATSLAIKGRKGSPIGLLFVIGDENEVLERSKALNYNPFTAADVYIGDKVVESSLGEFAKLDGAFVISNDGKVVSSGRYLEPRIQDADVPSGLGSRHMAGSGITETTNAVSIVVSESDGRIRCFMDGDLIINFDPTENKFVY